MFSFIKKGDKKSDDKSKDQVDQNQNKVCVKQNLNSIFELKTRYPAHYG
jgi:hypothetical protein